MGLKLRVFKSIILVFICGIVSSCNLRKETSLFNATSDTLADTITRVHVVNDQGAAITYKIKEKDKILIRNKQDINFLVNSVNQTTFSNSTVNTVDKDQTFEVDFEGNIHIPIYGKIRVKDLTRLEAQATLQKLFEKDQVNPIIELSIVNLKITLLGEFKTQGNFLIEQENYNLIDAIAQAGGLTESADLKSLKIIRGNRSNPEIIYVNLSDIKSLASPKLDLQNNDLIVIQPQRAIVAAKKFQNVNSLLQPVLVLLNLGLLILTISK